MEKTTALSKIKLDAEQVIAVAAKLPTVHVNRENYLRAQFKKHCDDALLERVVELGPAEAGVPTKLIKALAQSTIRHETTIVTGISAVAGIPGGWALAATIPADIAQFHGAMIRTAQKLAYLYGWPELFEDGGEHIDDDTKNVLLLFMGVMYGIQGATTAIEKLANIVAVNVAKTLETKALTKTLVYPIVKKIAHAIGVKMTKSIFARGVSKAIPVAGAVLSGGVTYLSFRPMANRLNLHLSKMHSTRKRAIRNAALK